jgi:hypothetical protein
MRSVVSATYFKLGLMSAVEPRLTDFTPGRLLMAGEVTAYLLVGIWLSQTGHPGASTLFNPMNASLAFLAAVVISTVSELALFSLLVLTGRSHPITLQTKGWETVGESPKWVFGLYCIAGLAFGYGLAHFALWYQA